MRLSATRLFLTRDLSPSERRFVGVLQELRFCELERAKVRSAAGALDPSPIVLKILKFGAADSQPRASADFELKESMADPFEYIRGVDDGETRFATLLAR